ncbi:MAG: hypothetical protein L0099_15150, partial [Acidobacteria bacterium]|nr:hypothetical protein [Acidobacteriota bacterium]
QGGRTYLSFAPNAGRKKLQSRTAGRHVVAQGGECAAADSQSWVAVREKTARPTRRRARIAGKP